MKKNLFIWQICGLTFTAILGTLFHFLYNWTNLKFIALFSAVNESTWEHMKLVFLPSILFAFIQSFYSKDDYPCFWFVKLIGILLSTLLIPILFYTLSGAFGTLSAITNIIIFFISVFLGYFVEFLLFKQIKCNKAIIGISKFVLLGILVLFIVFVFYPPKIPLFLDPITKTYGIYIT